jgi:hypothetical protein
MLHTCVAQSFIEFQADLYENTMAQNITKDEIIKKLETEKANANELIAKLE